jgi:lambda family phage portal protein
MGLIDRVRLAAAAIAGNVSASWNWRGGTKSGHMFDGSKFKGSAVYPSNYGKDVATLRERSRVAYWDSTQAQAMIGRLVDNVVGTGLALECRPIWPLTGDQGKTDEERHAWVIDVEQRFNLWASSHEPDAAGRMTLYELQAFELLNRLRDGETFHILRYSGDARRMSPLSLQKILPEQVVTPADRLADEYTKYTGVRVWEGIEIDEYGAELAIHIAPDPLKTDTTRIPVFGPSGRRFVLHPTNDDTLASTRGTPMLANCIHELQKITDGTVAELEAMVLNAILAVWVKPGPDAPASRALAGVQRRGVGDATETKAATETSQTTFDKPGLIVQSLKAGEELVSYDTKRPNINAATFVDHIVKHIAASKGVPIEVVTESFNANYSASRASLLLFWKKVEIERARSASQFNGLIFEAWFTEEVRSGRIQAPGFDASPVIRRAWLNCAWNGDKQPSIDPLKEAQADDVRIAQGATTRERVAMEYNGSDAMENIQRLATENVELAEANAPLAKTAPTAPAAPDTLAVDQNADDQSDGTEADNTDDNQGETDGA